MKSNMGLKILLLNTHQNIPYIILQITKALIADTRMIKNQLFPIAKVLVRVSVMINFNHFNDGMTRLFEGDRVHDLIKQRLVSGLGLLGKKATVVAIHRNTYSGVLQQARVQSFQITAKAMEKKCGGDANLKFGWYGGTRDEICEIMKHGFSAPMIDSSCRLYGSGIYLSPDNSPVECVKKLNVGKDGLRHMMLCRVILGKAEVVHPGSDQYHPSSDEFDSGMDNLSSPKKYIVWSAHMNTHILPEYVISFRAPSNLKGYFRTPESTRTPTSPWMPFPSLISALSKFLPPTTTKLIIKYYRDHRVSNSIRFVAGTSI
ncbi:INACTIVE POLY [ADP-RIBOSE] polymerase SRO4-RELATED [Salix purpurea]|uniref:INACTIVE POLY [ADP-RIBOSE] polymerase SRO4-RELATED n=1 Tax=Salix purpurea TaxID=77065 RepID=A0A9Q0W538_SALPP|nr:INACTIVE POLY [ADP-RIBOSE] polymerase SRO4-RELATED [Salix purpurea]